MAKISPEERQRRRDRVAAEALESVAKSEQFNFRVDAETIKQLYAIAGEQRKPVGALVREWIVDRLHQEQVSPSPIELLKEIHEFRQETVACLRAMYQNFAVHSTPPEPVPLAFLQQPDHAQVRSDPTPNCLHLAASVPMPVPYPVPFPKMPDIPKAELFMVLNSLPQTKPGYYEVPDWMVEHFKDQLQPR